MHAHPFGIIKVNNASADRQVERERERERESAFVQMESERKCFGFLKEARDE